MTVRRRATDRSPGWPSAVLRGLRVHDLGLDQVVRSALQDVAERDQGVRAQPLRRLGHQPVDLLVSAEAVRGLGRFLRIIRSLVWVCR